MKRKLALYPDTFVWHKGVDGLMYNSDTGNHLTFSVEDPLIKDFCQKLDDIDNLYVVDVSESESDCEYNQLLENISEMKFGEVLPFDEPFISFPPNPYVINRVERMKDTENHKFEVLNNLSTIILYLGGKAKPNEWYRQAIYPLNSDKILPFDKFSTIIQQCGNFRTVELKIVVSERLKDIYITCLESSAIKKVTLFFNPESFLLNEDVVETIKRNGWQIVLSMDPEDVSRFAARTISADLPIVPDSKIFLIDSEKSLSLAESLEQKYQLRECCYIPVWNDNLEFFKKQVLLEEEDILQGHQTKRQIHIHQLVNVNYWGQLSVMPNGEIFSDINNDSIGNVGEAISELVLKELISTNSWRRIRDYGKCSDCLFQWLCPSPTTFEKLTGFTLCNKN